MDTITDDTDDTVVRLDTLDVMLADGTMMLGWALVLLCGRGN